MRASRLLLMVLVLAACGLGVSGYLASRAVSVEHANESEAGQQFHAARAAFGSTSPMLQIDASGHVLRAPSPPRDEGTSLRQLRILVYRVQDERLVRADVPFWVVTLKGPALQYATRGTGVDLDRLGITPADIKRHGPGPILDETRSNGDRVLVWVE
jgi:hypothetical protein